MIPERFLIIIGAGLAGLSAGCYRRMNGYRVQLLEQDTRPGGLCTSWERGGYTLHGNMAFLAGSGPGVTYHRIWQELGVLPGIQVVDCECMLIIEGRDGRTFYFHTDLERLEPHMREIAPQDGRITIFDWLEGKYADARIRTIYETWPVSHPAIIIALGVARIFPGFGISIWPGSGRKHSPASPGRPFPAAT